MQIEDNTWYATSAYGYVHVHNTTRGMVAFTLRKDNIEPKEIHTLTEGQFLNCNPSKRILFQYEVLIEESLRTKEALSLKLIGRIENNDGEVVVNQGLLKGMIINPPDTVEKVLDLVVRNQITKAQAMKYLEELR